MTSFSKGHAANRLMGGDPRSQITASDLPSDIEPEVATMTAEDGAVSRGVLWRRRGTRPKVGIHVMHPRADHAQHYTVQPFIEAGYAVLGRSSRWPGNDAATIHEHLLLDLAAGVRTLHEAGCEQVILLGNSGGGPLATFYQSQARTAPPNRLTDTPAGDPLDLNQFDLPPADALVMIGTHLGEGPVMGRCLDPAVVDEDDPLLSDPELDLYDPRNGFRPPPESSKYSEEFLARYRAGQLARARRLDAVAQEMVDRQREAKALVDAGHDDLRLVRASVLGTYMVIYRTMADPAMVDLSIDPDDRLVRSYLPTGRPDLDNYDESGFARYITPRAWLSTWSPLSSRAHTARNLTNVTDPMLLVTYLGDCGMRREDAAQIMESSASTDKELYEVPKAEHYGLQILDDGSLGPRTSAGTDRAVDWVRERFPL